MLQSKMRWGAVDTDPSRNRDLADQLGVSPLIAQLLINRGIDDPERARRFLHVRVSELYDPFLLDGMEQAVQRIRRALESREKIRIYGDYDADGVSSTGLIIKTFRLLEANVDYYIPNRFTEGYGLNREALTQAKESGVDLVISVDTGISAVQEAEHCRELGLDLIITDHHEPPEILPEALAVINPKKPGCSYPFDMLAGVGVALKLAHALLGRVPEELLEIAALGTIADLVPLVDENRVIASLGLERMNRRQQTGLAALMEVSGVDGEVSAGHVGFSLGPRINASGRLDSAVRAVDLLLTEDEDEARMIAEELDRMNRERQKLVENIAEEASAMVEADPEAHRRFIVVAAPGWNVGVIGIVASRLVEKYYRPTIVLGIDEETGMAKGSARSIDGLDMYQALTRCADLLPHFGGHRMAAGMSLPEENLQELHRRLDELAKEWLREEDYIPLSRVDAELTLDEVQLDLIEELDRLAPYGVGNPTPRFRVSGAALSKLQRIGRDKNHLKLKLEDDGHYLDAIGFRQGELAEEIAPAARLELLGELAVNEWNNRRAPQLLIRDICVPHVQIFDWRSNRDKSSRFRRLADGETLFLISGERDPAGFWTEKKALFRRWPEVESPLNPESVRRMVLVDLPASEELFRWWLQRCSCVERIYFAFGDAELEGGLSRTPDRDQFKRLYSCLLGCKGMDPQRDLAKVSRWTGLSQRWIQFMLEVFRELGFVTANGGRLEIVAEAEKRPLSESRLLRTQRDREQLQQVFVYSSYRDLCTYVSSVISSELNLGGAAEWTLKKKSG
ncbi:single-stranded-DNA-specific exonuclease RecJ [Paludifilum halophilum]|uniref:Single-stranded-DNA-specific exonuclease RecJ n=1 Tax=Paludifilum halophilum TaxID=1642702 RepID=A0A235BD75_9BACL|nr:single-stranded-DNA-specific exonuclease RecJ [Paludifilum halophilum]OYD09897.1 single-stranded-DNA-specific exonuclease RecJ [Paludifilum halophilum]